MHSTKSSNEVFGRRAFRRGHGGVESSVNADRLWHSVVSLHPGGQTRTSAAGQEARPTKRISDLEHSLRSRNSVAELSDGVRARISSILPPTRSSPSCYTFPSPALL